MAGMVCRVAVEKDVMFADAAVGIDEAGTRVEDVRLPGRGYL